MSTTTLTRNAPSPQPTQASPMQNAPAPFASNAAGHPPARSHAFQAAEDVYRGLTASAPRQTYSDDAIRAAGLQLRAAASQSTSAPARPISVEEVESIARIEDATIRNYRITQAYHDLSDRMASVLGTQEANWCSFACWASRQAGQSIRREDLPGMPWLPYLLGGPVLGLAVDAVTRETSEYVGRGNKKVYEEIAPQFARFITAFEGQSQPDPGQLERFLADLKPGRPEDGGQELLRAAFVNYWKAKYESDPKKRSELVFLANAQVGLHEQTRLQPEISMAMPPGLKPLTTKLMTELEMPHETLELGEDVPVHDRLFPPGLEKIENPELRSLLHRYDRTPDTTWGSGAKDWSRLGDRMNYIVDLFRTRQADASLFEQPLTWREQLRVLDAGHDKVGVA